MIADCIIHSANIATCSDHTPRASALAIWRDRILAVGSQDDVLPLASPCTRVVDLCGRFVCPGFIDSHVHLGQWALVESGVEVQLDGTRSLAETLERIAGRIPAVPRGAWLRGRGWDKNQWPGDRFPTAADLDAVTGDIPAALPSHDGHSLWVNSAAMRIAGIPQDAPDPPGGRFLRDEHGRPSGVMQEAAGGLIWPHVPAYTHEETVQAFRTALPAAARMGVAGVHNMEGAESLRALQTLRETGELTLRVAQYVPTGLIDEARELGIQSGFGDQWLRLAGVKSFLDGALGGQTAAMLEPYEGSDNAGVLMMPESELREVVVEATRSGLAVALHAIGDRAVRAALDAYQHAREAWDGPWPRHRIEHAQHFHPADLPRCAELGIIASMQPVHLLADIDTCEKHIGSRGHHAFPLRSLLDTGAHLAFGSDAPVEIMDPVAGLRAAVLRQRRDGTPANGWHPAERLRPSEVLRAQTIMAAAATGEQHIKGSLEPGKLADLVVASHDLLSGNSEDMHAAVVLATVVGGSVVADSEGLFKTD